MQIHENVYCLNLCLLPVIIAFTESLIRINQVTQSPLLCSIDDCQTGVIASEWVGNKKV